MKKMARFFYQKRMSEEDELPLHDIASSVGRKACPSFPALFSGFLAGADDVGVLDTPSWNGVSWILLGV